MSTFYSQLDGLSSLFALTPLSIDGVGQQGTTVILAVLAGTATR